MDRSPGGITDVRLISRPTVHDGSATHRALEGRQVRSLYHSKLRRFPSVSIGPETRHNS